MKIIMTNTIRPIKHVQGVKTREQEIGAGPHVAAGNHHRQFEPGEQVVEPLGLLGGGAGRLGSSSSG